jgi:hypothetical protein
MDDTREKLIMVNEYFPYSGPRHFPESALGTTKATNHHHVMTLSSLLPTFQSWRVNVASVLCLFFLVSCYFQLLMFRGVFYFSPNMNTSIAM